MNLVDLHYLVKLTVFFALVGINSKSPLLEGLAFLFHHLYSIILPLFPDQLTHEVEAFLILIVDSCADLILFQRL